MWILGALHPLVIFSLPHRSVPLSLSGSHATEDLDGGDSPPTAETFGGSGGGSPTRIGLPAVELVGAAVPMGKL